jgi:PEGA domain
MHFSGRAMMKPSPLPPAAREPSPSRVPCATCGVLNLVMARHCQACGTALGQATSNVILSPSLLGVAPRAAIPQVSAAGGIDDVARATRAAREPTVLSVARRTRISRLRMTGIGLAVALAGGALGLAYRTGFLHLSHDVGATRDMLRAAEAWGAGTGATGARAIPTDANATAPAPSPDPAQIPPGMGLLETASAQPGHRIFVDGRTMGQTPQSVLVKCGKTSVKIGSAGHLRAVDIPCGKAIDVKP